MSKPSSRPSKIKTQDEPFNLDALEKEASSKDYRFILGGREWVMAPIGRLDRKAVKALSQMTKAGDLDDADFTDEMFKLAMGEEAFAEFDALPLSQEGLSALFSDWSDHSGIEVPESSASSDS